MNCRHFYQHLMFCVPLPNTYSVSMKQQEILYNLPKDTKKYFAHDACMEESYFYNEKHKRI